jgi:hypothetical protein
MTVAVELGLSKAFTLDDPIAGVIGSTEFVLGGVEFVDVTDRVQSVSINRGKNRDLDRFSAGTLSVTFKNQDRAFDPLFTSSPFAGNIVPRRDVRVMVDSVSQYVGKVVDWNFDYAPGGDSYASLEASDAFTFLALQKLTPGTAVPQSTGARLLPCCLSLPWIGLSDQRDLDTGASLLGADVFEGNVLEYLQTVETSEQGLFFIGKDGRVVFRDRLATPTVDDVTVFADDGTGIPFSFAQIDFGTELLYNQITVTSPVATAVADGLLSQTRYGIIAETVDTLLSDSEQVEGLANFIVGRYSEPEYRFAQVTVNVDSLSVGDRAKIVGLECGDVCEVKFTPNGLGSPIQRFGLVIGLQNQIAVDRHDVTIGLGSLQTSLFVIGDAEFGTIGVDAPGVLGF